MSKIGEGIGENQRTLKDKEGKGLKNQPKPCYASSQKDVSINKESNTISIHLLPKGYRILKRALIQEHRTLRGTLKPNT